jgi:hypothetical protein
MALSIQPGEANFSTAAEPATDGSYTGQLSTAA